MEHALVGLSVSLNFVLSWVIIRLLAKNSDLRSALESIEKIVKTSLKRPEPKKDSKPQAEKDPRAFYKVKLQK